MRKSIKKLCGILCAVVFLFLSGLSLHLPTAGADKRIVYEYIYYPSSQVYYSAVQHKYYYIDNGKWIYTSSLPAAIQLGKSVSIQLEGPVPYVFHPVVIKQYPVVIEND